MESKYVKDNKFQNVIKVVHFQLLVTVVNF